MHRKQHDYGEFDLQKVKQELHVTFFPAFIMHIFTHMRPSLSEAGMCYHCKFVKARNKLYMYLKCHFWLTFFKPTDSTLRTGRGMMLLALVRKQESHYDSAFTASEVSTNLWVGGSVNQECCNSHTFRLKMCLLDFK